MLRFRLDDFVGDYPNDGELDGISDADHQGAHREELADSLEDIQLFKFGFQSFGGNMEADLGDIADEPDHHHGDKDGSQNHKELHDVFIVEQAEI